MSRKKYERLYEIWLSDADNKKYQIYKSVKTNDYGRLLFTVICDSETTLNRVERHDYNIYHGIELNILLFDGCPLHDLNRILRFFWF